MDEKKEPYMNEFGGALLAPERTSVIVDSIGRTWRKCNQCERHYMTERWPGKCPACKLQFGKKPQEER